MEYGNRFLKIYLRKQKLEGNVRLIGYARCSSKEQCPDRQIIALREFGVPEDAIVVEMMSGKNFQRPAYQEMVKDLKPGDTLVLDALDRLGRDYDAVVSEWRFYHQGTGCGHSNFGYAALGHTKKTAI